MIITRTPLRVPLGGGGTDLPSYYQRYGGYLVSAAVDKYVYITVNRRFEDSIRISYAKTEIAEDVAQIEHPIVREALTLLGLRSNLEIVSIADAPANTGLGSSASFTVGLLHALHAYKREAVSPQQLAEEACYLELERLGEPIGKQDQYIAAYGGVTCLAIACDGTVHAKPAGVSEEVLHQLEHDLMFFYTGIRRSASAVLADQGRAVQRGEEEVTASMHTIKRIGEHVHRTLVDGDLGCFGELLHHHWEAKRRMSAKISSADIDAWYELALAQGATGGKLMGAGGGGFFMFYVGNGSKPRVRQALAAAGLREVRFGFAPDGSKVLVNL